MRIRALTFDTGGTILDWHGGVCHALTNDYRRLAMTGIVGQVLPAFNMDDVHRTSLDQVLLKHGLEQFDAQDRGIILRAWHELAAWPDFPTALSRIRQKLPIISFTMLPLSLVLEVSRKNDLNWDAVISCEMLGVYKPRPEAYLKAARWLGLEPTEILMVACHNFDLNAARTCGFRTAFVRRPDEWGPAGPPDPNPHPDSSLVVDGFEALAEKFGL